MNIGDLVKVINTNSVFDNKTGLVERIEDETITVFVNFIPSEDKKVRQDFNINNLELVNQEDNTSDEEVDESYKNKETNEFGDVLKDFDNGYVLFRDKQGKQSQVSKDDLEFIQDDEVTEDAVKIEFTDSFNNDLDDIDSKGRFDEIEWFLSNKGSLSFLKDNGLQKTLQVGKAEIETLSNNKVFKNENNIKVYSLKKGVGSHNQFRAYFFIKNNVCTFVRGHIKKVYKNSQEEIKAIQDTIDYASKSLDK